MAGHRRAEATPFFERLSLAMTKINYVFTATAPSAAGNITRSSVRQ